MGSEMCIRDSPKSMRARAQQLCFTIFERSRENDYAHSVFWLPQQSLVLLYNLTLLRPFDSKSMRALAYRLCFTTLERLPGNDPLGAPSYSSHSEHFKNTLFAETSIGFHENHSHFRSRRPLYTARTFILGRSPNMPYSSRSEQLCLLARKPLFPSYISGQPHKSGIVSTNVADFVPAHIL